MNQQQEVVVRLRLDPGNVSQASQQTAKALGDIGKAGETSARQTAAAMRQLPAQFTDIATQLAGGQNPLLILLQQGGQIKDSFGGVGAAVRGVAAAVTPTAVAFGALAGALGLVGVAAFQGVEQSERLRDVLALTGNAAGLTADRLAAMAQRVSDSSSQTVGAAREIALALASSGQVSSGAMETVAKAVARVADVTGEDATKIAADFARMESGVAKWAAEHNKAWNFITAEQFKYIQRLEEQGKAEEAMVFVGGRVIEHLKAQGEQLGTLEQLYIDAKKALDNFWQSQLNIGRDSLQLRLEGLRERQGRAERSAGTPIMEWIFGKPEDYQGEIDAILRDQIRAIDRALERSVAAQTERGKIDKLLNPPKKDGRREKPYIPGTFQVLDARDALIEAARYEKELGEFNAFAAAAERAQEDRDEKRMLAEEEFLQGMRDLARRAGIEAIEDERQRGEALIRLEQEINNRRLKAKGLSPAMVAAGEALNAQRAEYEIAALGRRAGSETYDDVRGALAAAFRDSNNPAKAFADALGNAIFTRVSSRLADALATAAVGRSGTGGALGDLLLLWKYSGTSSNPSAPNYENSFDLQNSVPPMATGTNYVPRDMFALLHRGEAVVPARYNPAAGGGAARGGEVHVHYHVPPGQSPASYAAALAENNRRIKAEVAADLARAGRPLNNAALLGAT